MNTFLTELERWVDINLDNCIGVDECMKACPVVDPSITIKDLNEATRPGTPVSAPIAKFAAECIQCARCDTVCPTSAGRSIMMLYLKAKLAAVGRQPAAYRRYLLLKGHDRSPFLIGANNLLNRGRVRALARHVDKKDFRKAPLLLYLGCYIFTKTGSARELVEMADRLGLEYEVLGGLRSCCGWPQLLAGAPARAEDYHGYLYGLIRQSDPAKVVTGCAECYASLVKIKRKYGAAFEPLTVPMWILEHADALDLVRSDETVTYHDSCHITRKLHHPQPARELLASMVNVVEMKRSGEFDTYCCGYWGLKANRRQLERVHRERFDEARGTGARRMIVECLTCLESFSMHPDREVEIEDILSLATRHSRLMKGSP
jgi:heterodisulfide reductase subunit D